MSQQEQAPQGTYVMQSWSKDYRDEILRVEGPYSLDKAREVALIHALELGFPSRIMLYPYEQGDYTEVYETDGSVRRGTHGQTILVTIGGSR